MSLAFIIGCSLLLQVVSAYFALRLITITRWKKAWLLLSVGIITMALRRAMTFLAILKGAPMTHGQDVEFELIGLAGSVLMLTGVVFIKPIFLSLTVAEQEQRALAAKLQDALSNIKVLSGLLPICASCRKIRDDNGYWANLETYVREHTDADFSHGICPDCARKLYPEYFAKASANEPREKK